MNINLLKKFKNLKEFILIRNSGLFNEDHYIQTYPEVKNQIINPIMDYIKTGWQEGKNPSPDFDTAYYLRKNPDVRQAGINPLVHFIRKGRAEGRLPRQADHRIYPRYPIWVEKFDSLNDKDRRQIQNRIKLLTPQPKFSIFYIVNNFPEEFLFRSIKSLQNQLYENWELLLLIEPKPEIHIQNQIWKLCQDKRITARIFEDENSLTINQSLMDRSGDYLGWMTPNAVLAPQSFYLFAEAIHSEPNSVLLYSDEDRLKADGSRYDPYFKPDWNPELFLYQDYLRHFALYRREAVEKSGGFSSGPFHAALKDLAMRIIETAQPENIVHIPFPLCHTQWDEASKRIEQQDEFNDLEKIKILEAHFDRLRIPATIMRNTSGGCRISYPLPEPEPLVSIIIPTRDNFQMLARCLRSLYQHTIYNNYEILVIDNQSSQPETMAFFESLNSDEKSHVIAYPHPFNYSAINNFAVDNAHGDVILFLNDDTEVITDAWLKELVSLTIRPEIGAVGPMLYFPDDTIQHAGVILGLNGVAGHIYHNEPRGYQGQRHRAQLPQNFTAITAACLAIERQKFKFVKGLDEINLQIALNDIDLCIRLHQKGFRNLWTPDVELYHYESASRGVPNTTKEKEQLHREIKYFVETHGHLLNNDPSYNPNLSLNNNDFQLAFPPRIEKPWRKQDAFLNKNPSVIERIMRGRKM
jgi:GT2 family glycosyltransferase